jgi:hypothetical protein
VLNGGAGFDYADYRDKATGVTVDLALTTAQPLADGDRLSGIEAVIGGAGADVLRGSSVAKAQERCKRMRRSLASTRRHGGMVGSGWYPAGRSPEAR